MPTDDVRLIHGDMTTVLQSLPDYSIDFIYTDPPFGVNNNGGHTLMRRREVALGQGPLQEERRIAGDASHEEAENLVQCLFTHAGRLLPAGAAIACFAGSGGVSQQCSTPIFAHWAILLDKLVGFKQAVVWDKGRFGMGWHYRRSYEFILVGQRPGKARWYDTSHRIESVIRPGQYGIKKLIPRKHNHPTEKPVALAEHFLRLHTKPGDLVLDPFMGSGSTGEACIKLGRRFLGIELDAAYFEMAYERLVGPLPVDLLEAGLLVA